MSNKFEILFNWIKNNGGFIHKNIIIKNNKLSLSKPIETSEENLFTLPRKLCIDSGVYKNFKHPLYNKLTENEKYIFNLPIFKLIINLINEKLKGKKSFYSPFISSLPQMNDLKLYPIFHYKNEKDIWNTILPGVIKKLDNLNNFYESLYLVILKLKIFNNIEINRFIGYNSIEEILKALVLWGYLIINNYALEKNFISPLFNLIHYNHETKNKLLTIDDNINLLYKDVEKLDIIINNGLLDNETLFTLHGYINSNNIKKYLEIKLNDKYSVENDNIKDVIIHTFDNLFKNDTKYYITSNAPSVELVQYLRIVSLNNRDLQFIKGDDEYFKKFISMDNEFLVYKYLLIIVKNKYEEIKMYNSIISDTDNNHVKILKKILLEQKDILEKMYYEIYKKWIRIIDNEYDDESLKKIFKLNK